MNVVGVPARLAPKNGDAVFGVASRHVGGKVEVQELVVKGPAIGNGGGRCRAYGNSVEGAYEGELGQENGGVGAVFWHLGGWWQRSCGSTPNHRW